MAKSIKFMPNKHEDPSSSPRQPSFKLVALTQAWKPLTGEPGTSRFLELTGQPVQPNWGTPGSVETLSQILRHLY